MMKKFKEFEGIIDDSDRRVPVGYRVMTNTAKVSPGGGWRITLEKGVLIRYGITGTYKLEKYDPTTGNWKNVTPPIQGVEDFNPQRYARNPEQREMVSQIVNNSKPITPAQAKKFTGVEINTTVGKVNDELNKLNLSPSQKIKIIIL